MLKNLEITVKRSCELVGLSHTGWYRPPQESVLNLAIRHRMRQLASECPAFGSPRLTILLQPEFGVVNHKRVERLYAEEGLLHHWFESLYEAREVVEAWRQDYNHVRPHSSLDYQTPKEVARQHEMIKNQFQPRTERVSAEGERS